MYLRDHVFVKPLQPRYRGESLHCALLLDYVLPEEPPSTPLGNALRIK